MCVCALIYIHSLSINFLGIYTKCKCHYVECRYVVTTTQLVVFGVSEQLVREKCECRY